MRGSTNPCPCQTPVGNITVPALTFSGKVRAVGVQDHEGVLYVYSRTEPRYPSPRVQCEGLSEGSGEIPVARPRFSSVGNRGSKEKEYAFNPKLHVRK